MQTLKKALALLLCLMLCLSMVPAAFADGEVIEETTPSVDPAAPAAEEPLNDEEDPEDDVDAEEGSGLLISGNANIVIPDVEISEDIFPDPVLREALTFFDTDGNGALSYRELKNTRTITLINRGLTDLTGIQCLFALDTLNVSDNKLESLDVSGLHELRNLSASGCGLEEINLGDLPALRTLNLSSNKLEALDLSGAPNLRTLNVTDNALSALNVSGMSELLSVEAVDNLFEDVDASNCPKLRILRIADSLLDTVNVSGCQNLLWLDISDNYVVSVDLSDCPNLIVFIATDTGLRTLDVSQNPKLRALYVEECSLEELDLRNNPVIRCVVANGRVQHETSEYGNDIDVYRGNAEILDDYLPVYTGLRVDAETRLILMKEPSYSYAIALEDNLSLRFYVRGLDENTDPADYTISWTYNGESYSAPLTSLEENEFILSRSPARQMCDEAEVTVCYKDTVLKTGRYSVRSYCEAMMDITSDETLRALMGATLDYGSEAQLYFDYNTDDLANRGNAYTNYAELEIPESKNTKEGACTGIGAVTYALEVVDTTVLDVYFAYQPGMTTDDFSFTLDGEEVVPAVSGGRFVFRITGIGAKDLDGQHVIVITNSHDNSTFRFTTCVLNYLYASRIGAFSNTAKAMYGYHLAAKDYFPAA